MLAGSTSRLLSSVVLPTEPPRLTVPVLLAAVSPRETKLSLERLLIVLWVPTKRRSPLSEVMTVFAASSTGPVKVCVPPL